MSKETDKLGSLDYKPPGATKQPANLSPATLGMNSHVIKPETRVNNREDAEQPLKAFNPHPCNYVNQQRLKD